MPRLVRIRACRALQGRRRTSNGEVAGGAAGRRAGDEGTHTSHAAPHGRERLLDLRLARRASDECIFMYMGRVVEHSKTEDMFIRPVHEQTADYIEGRFG